MRYLNGLEPAHIESQARIFLSALFGSLHIKTVHIVGSALLPEEALGKFAAQLAGIKIKHQPTQGLTFALDKEKNVLSRWSLFLEGGPLPELSLCTYHGTGFRSPHEWPVEIMKTTATNVLWFGGKGYWGLSEGDLYLYCKRAILGSSLFLGVPDSSAAGAGFELRRICQTVQTMKARRHSEYFKLSDWSWRQRRFLKSFDSILIESLGAEKLADTLRAMDIDPDRWLSGS